MDEQAIIESLSPIEQATIKRLSREVITTEALAEKTGQDSITLTRAIGLLKNKGLVTVKSSEEQMGILGILGINYIKKQLPERSLINKLSEKETIPIGEVKNACGLNDNEAKAAIGILKKHGLIAIDGGRLRLIPSGTISMKMPQELLLEKLPVLMASLNAAEQKTFKELLVRKELVAVETTKRVEVALTASGEMIMKHGIETDLLEQLTPKMLKQNSWKGKKFRRYDLQAAAPRMYGGKRHFVNQAKDYARSIWLEMGFKEMSGNLVDTSFWVFDTLFTAQDHPVREMQDTFYLKGAVGKLPVEQKKKGGVISMTRKAHEGGVDGSRGWHYAWNAEDAKKVLLRTHTTCLSARTLKKIAENNEFPAKYFALGKCFRNETVDWSHGFEFNQTEGIVVDENANFRQLLGYLKQFFSKMGYDQIRIRPAYFAYTEPSLEIDAFHPTKKTWVELGGAGMFRPEVTIPMFGRHIPVLAWGPGFDRIIMEYFKIEDLRDMYKNDITKLREMKFWNK